MMLPELSLYGGGGCEGNPGLVRAAGLWAAAWAARAAWGWRAWKHSLDSEGRDVKSEGCSLVGGGAESFWRQRLWWEQRSGHPAGLGAKVRSRVLLGSAQPAAIGTGLGGCGVAPGKVLGAGSTGTLPSAEGCRDTMGAEVTVTPTKP